MAKRPLTVNRDERYAQKAFRFAQVVGAILLFSGISDMPLGERGGTCDSRAVRSRCTARGANAASTSSASSDPNGLPCTRRGDEAVPVTNTRMWAETVRELNLNHEYKEYPGVTHGPIVEAAMPGIFAFFSTHSRARR